MSSRPGETFGEWKARRERHGQVWVQVLCAAIQAPNPLTGIQTGKPMAPHEVADAYLEAYQDRENGDWQIDSKEDGDGES